MKLGEIDLKKKPIEPKLFLCKRNKSTIKKLNENFGLQYNSKLGTLNEISFKLPVKIDINHYLVDNPSIEMVKHRRIFKLKLGNYTEYFLFNEKGKSYGEGEESITYHAFSLGYELNDKIIRSYEEVSKTFTEHATIILQETNWRLGYVDSEFDLKYRSYDVSSQTALQCLYELAEKYNGVLIWDTVKREVSIHRPDNVGRDRGLSVKYNKYLQSLDQNENSEEVITRLKLYGKEDVNIRRLNPSGMNYLEDFSYYLYPFKRDENRNVIEHAYDMSDELCHAIMDQNELIASKEDEFQSYLNIKETLQQELTVKDLELFELEVDLKKILDRLDVSNRLGNINGEYSPDHMTIVAEKDAKILEIEAKESEIDAIKNRIKVEADDKIDLLRETLSTENNFTPELLLELNDYIIEKEYTNDTIVEDKDLLKEGLEVFKNFREPKISLNINIINFLEVVECQNDWDKLTLGDTIKVKLEQLGINTKAKIIEINYNFQEKSISLTIANEKEIKDKDQAFMDMIYNANAASTTVNMDKYKWNLSLENNGVINGIINNKWDANKNAIEAGSKQLIEIGDRGIIVRSPDDPNVYLVMQNGLLAITNDGGNSWKHSITHDGIVGERIYSKIFMGVNLAIEDEDGVIKFRGSKGQIFNRNGDEVMRLGLVSEPPDPDCFGLVLDNTKHQVSMTSCDGFKINRKTNGEWIPVMYADLDGNFWVKDFKARNLTIEDDDGYFKFSGNKGEISDGTRVVMKLGYLNYESPEDFGIIVQNSVNKMYMTRNRGFEITRFENENWVTKFKADKFGGLYAEDITTKNIKIIDGELGERIQFDINNGITITGQQGEKIYLNGNEGIRIAVNGEDKFWVNTEGGLQAEDITTKSLKIIDGKLGERILFDHLTGITINGEKGEHIYLNANEGIKIDVNGDKRFWIGTDGTLRAKKLIITPDNEEEVVKLPDGSFISDLTVKSLRSLNSSNPQDYVYIRDNFVKLITGYGGSDDREKFKLWLEGSGSSSYPKMQLGAGNAGNDVGYIYKDSDGLKLEFLDPSGSTRKLWLGENIIGGVTLDSDTGDLEVKNNKGSLKLTQTSLELKFGSQSITMSSTGIKINGTRIDLN